MSSKKSGSEVSGKEAWSRPTIKILGPIKVTKAAFDKNAVRAINNALERLDLHFQLYQAVLNKQCTDQDSLRMRVTGVQGTIKKLAEEVKAMEKKQALQIGRELGERTGKMLGTMGNTVVHPVSAAHLFFNTALNCWQGVKKGFKDASIEFEAMKEAARAVRAAEEKEAARCKEQVFSDQELEAQAFGKA